MRGNSFVLAALVMWICSISIAYTQTTETVWEQKSNFIGGKGQGGISFTVGRKAYVCMATTGKDFWEYDIDKEEWKKLPDFPGDDRKDGVAFTIGNKGYVGMGSNEKADFADLWEYDPATAHWTQKADLPCGGRHGCIGFSVNGKGYIGLGENEQSDVRMNSTHNDLWQYDPATNKWTRKADIPDKGRSDASVFIIQGEVHVLFGIEQAQSALGRENIWIYNAEKNTWAKGDDFPGMPRVGASVFSVKDNGYVFGGSDGVDKRYGDFWEYNSASKKWEQQNTAPLPSARNDAFCFVVDSVAYLGTGKIKNSVFGSGTNDFWCMHLKTNIDFPAKLLYQKDDRKVPLAQQGVSLLTGKKVLQTTTTDSTGSFAFKKIDADGKYQVVLDKNDKLPANAVVSIAKPNGKIVKDLEKNSDGQFTYEVTKLDFMSEDDSYFNLQYFMKSADKDVTITSHISYTSGSSDLSDDARNILYQVIVSLKQYPNLNVLISSHTDAVGNEEDNMALSEKRAQVVVAYIVSNGIDPKRVSGKGYGSTKLLNKCGHGVKCSEEENMVNRRTEFTFSKQ